MSNTALSSRLRLPFKRLHPQAIIPTRNHSTDAGLDLYALPGPDHPELACVLLGGNRVTIGTGVAVAIPEGYYGQIFGRSGLASRGITPIGGVIDSSYRGEIKVVLVNLSHDAVVIKAGDKIAQIVILQLPSFSPVEVDDLGDTVRGDQGFGSSGD